MIRGSISEMEAQCPGNDRHFPQKSFGHHQIGSLMLSHRPPIHRLSSETLSNIFLLTTFSFNEHSEVISALLTITHTCSRWRCSALSTGQLWVSLVMHIPNSSAQRSRIQAWTSRSKNYPLDVFLDFRDEDWNWDEDSHMFTSGDMKDALDLLFPHIKRWRHFELLTDTWAPIHTFLALTSNISTPPLLETIALSRCNEYFVKKGERFIPAMLKAPVSLFGGVQSQRLREVSLVGVHVAWSSPSLSNLLELELKYHAFDVVPTFQEFTDILAACPELRRLSILGWGPRLDPVANDLDQRALKVARRYACLPRVTHFALGFVDVDYVLELLSLLKFSARLSHLELEDLSASVDYTSLSLDASPVLDLLTRSSASNGLFMGRPDAGPAFSLSCVEHLELRSIRAREDVFASFLTELSSVERISLLDADPNFLAALGPQDFLPLERVQPEEMLNTTKSESYPSRRPSFTSSLSTSLAPCPRLVDMICRRVDTNMLCSMVAARAKAGSGVQPLQTVEIDLAGTSGDEYDICSSVEELSEDDLHTLVDSGVNVRIIS